MTNDEYFAFLAPRIMEAITIFDEELGDEREVTLIDIYRGHGLVVVKDGDDTFEVPFELVSLEYLL